MARAKLTGTDYTPPDLVAKVTGRARYAEDFRADGMVFMKLLLSPMPHAHVRRIDKSRALAMDGVLAVVTAEDLPESDPLNEPLLASEALYEGQPIAAVVAVDEATAADAVERLQVDLEPLPFALDPIESIKPGGSNARTEGNTIVRKSTDDGVQTVVERIEWPNQLFRDAGEDVLPLGEHQDEWTIGGDVEAALAASELVIDETAYHQSLTHHPLEPRSAMAYWQNGKCTLHCSTQSCQRTHGVAAAAIGIDPADLTLISEFCGGGFGSKIVGTVNMALPAVLSKQVGRPVMHRVSRYEENYFGRARPGMYIRTRIGFSKEGKVKALDIFAIQDNGPYGRQGDLGSVGGVASLAYQPDSMRFRAVSILTNTPPRAPQRAPGGAPISAMLEPIMDRAAKQLGLDRIAIRKLNAPREGAKFGGDLSRNVTTAYTHEAMDQLAALVDWADADRRGGTRSGSKAIGTGFALAPYTAGASGFDGLMVIRPDGKLEIHSGVGNLGTHSFSDTSRVACDVLGLPWEEVEIVWGDTSKHLPWTTVSAGSMTTHSMSRAAHAAATDLMQKLQEIAARDLGGSPEQYEVDGGRVFRRGSASGGLTFAQAAKRAIELGGKYDGHELSENLHAATKVAAAAMAGQGLLGAAKDEYPRNGDVYTFVVGFAEVEVDLETGFLDIKRYAAVTDCGTVMNPRSLGAQLHGGGIQGFGLAASQKWVYDPRWGIPFAHRFYTARPPSILDVPLEMQWGAVDKPDPNNPVGSKGVGEPPLCAGAAALLCAIQNAVGEVDLRRLPIMTDNLLTAIEGLDPEVPVLTTHT
ncbi:MAG TPA: xanthine dehydrogenase family protein molybdopterin-binding subunit [Thermoanaerobaculia bacterium]|nr:xanthine dehydrogenase family protein molybdopterin-binding subunit [Thermoanaerobaculia bacterium]